MIIYQRKFFTAQSNNYFIYFELLACLNPEYPYNITFRQGSEAEKIVKSGLKDIQPCVLP